MMLAVKEIDCCIVGVHGRTSIVNPNAAWRLPLDLLTSAIASRASGQIY
jgi:hypothetical protein